MTAAGEKGRIGNHNVASPQRRLIPAGCGKAATTTLSSPRVVLLPAARWDYDLEPHRASSATDPAESIYPPLPALVDSFITTALGDDRDLAQASTLHGSYLYDYVPEMKDRSFADLLQPDNRQFHHDSLCGMVFGSILFLAHERIVRDEIRRGTRQVQECSDPNNPKLFFIMPPDPLPPPPYNRRL